MVVVLPFDPVMATMRPGQKLRREFDLADHGLAQRARLHQRRRIHGNSGTDHDQILPAERALAVPAGLDGDAVIEQHGNFVAQVRRRSWCQRR